MRKDTEFQLSVPELLIWIAICIAIGTRGVNSYTEFWSQDGILRCYEASGWMSLKRFEAIGRYLHLPLDPETIATDSFWKVRWLFDQFRERCESNWHPSQNLALDEASPGYMGRFNHVVRTIYKKVSSAILLICVVDSAFAMLVTFVAAADPTVAARDGLIRNSALAFWLAERVYNAHKTHFFHFFMDNLYTTPALYVALWSEFSFLATGTWRNGSGYNVPRCLSQASIGRGEHKLAVMLMKRDRRLIGAAIAKDVPGTFYMLTSYYYEFKLVLTGSRMRRARLDIQADYNKNKNGVDVFDQYMANYSTYMKSVKWWKRIFFWVLDAGVLNAYQIYRIFHAEIERKSFLLVRSPYFILNSSHVPQSLARELVAWANQEMRHSAAAPPATPRTPKRRRTSEPPQPAKGPCMPVSLGKKEDNNRPYQRPCVYCRETRGTRQDASWKCSACDVALCLSHDRNCFALYHEKH